MISTTKKPFKPSKSVSRLHLIYAHLHGNIYHFDGYVTLMGMQVAKETSYLDDICSELCSGGIWRCHL